MADEQVNGLAEGGSPAAETVTSPPSAPAASVTGNVGASAPATTASDFVSIRDAAKEYGYDLSSHADDAVALRHLVDRARMAEQAQQMLPYAQTYLQNQEQFNEYLRQKQEQAKAKEQAQKPKWWNPPEYNPAWNEQVQVDPNTGQLTAKNGAPLDIVPKVLAYHQYRREFAEKLLSNPAETLRPLIEEVAQEQAKQLIQQNLGGYQAQVYADQFIQSNSSWIHQQDANGKVVFDQNTGRPALSPLGQRFAAYVAQAQKAGISDERQQAHWAMKAVQSDYLAAQLQSGQQQQKAAPAAENSNAFKRNIAPNGRETIHGSIQNQKSKPLSERLRESIAAAGGIGA